MSDTALRRWRPLSVARVCELLASADFPWWICGGLAIDLFLGRTTREHADVDVGVLRVDAPALFRALDSFEVHLARDGELQELAGDALDRAARDPAAHGFWCRPRGGTAWVLEVLLNDGDRDTFTFRRDPRVSRPLALAVERNAAGVPYLAPEIQLLFKAKQPREKDTQDFEATLPALAAPRRAWLRDALAGAHPGHPWLGALTPTMPDSTR